MTRGQKRNKQFISMLLTLTFVLGISFSSQGLTSAATFYGNGTALSPYLIRTVSDFNRIPEEPSAHYLLVNDLDFQNAKITPMPEFKGILDGGNHTIRNFEIVNANGQFIGLFSRLNSATIQNITIENPTVTAPESTHIGVITGDATNSIFINCIVENPDINGLYYTGVFVGRSNNSDFTKCYSIGSKILASSNTGAIIGRSQGANLIQCYSTTDLTNKSSNFSMVTGGLVGYAYGPTTISECFVKSNILHNGSAGGLVGSYSNSLSIRDSYAQVSIKNTMTYDGYINGGIVGINYPATGTLTIENCYFTGKITGNEKFPIAAEGTITNSYFDKTVLTITEPASQARTTAEMQKKKTYTNWDFNTIWSITEGTDYPQLQFSSKPRDISITNIQFLSGKQNVVVGETLQLSPFIQPEYATNKTLTYTSKNNKIAEVSETGVVTGIAPGEVTIQAVTANKLAAECTITVTAPVIPTTGVILSQSIAELTVGDNLSLTAKVMPENASNKNLLWNSSNANVAAVNDKGEVQALSEGYAAIAVMTETGNHIAFCNIIVKNKVIQVEQVTITPESVNLETGESMQLHAEVFPQEAADKTLVWTSSDNSTVTVDSTGIITAAITGTAIITASTPDGLHRAECQVTVTEPVPLENLALGADASSNSVSSSAYSASKAVDGDYETRWLAKTNVSDVYLVLDFGKAVSFNQIHLSEFAKRVDKYAIQIWNDSDWIDIHSGQTIGEDLTINFDTVTASKVRLMVYSTLTSYGPSIYEFEVYKS